MASNRFRVQWTLRFRFCFSSLLVRTMARLSGTRFKPEPIMIVASAFLAPPQIHAPVLNRETGNLRVQSVPLPRSRGSASTRNDSNRHLFSVELPWPTPDPSFEVPLVTGRPFFAHRLCELFQCVCLTGVMKSDENPSSIIPEHRFFPHGVNHSPMLG